MCVGFIQNGHHGTSHGRNVACSHHDIAGEEEFEDTIGVNRIRKSKNRHHNGQNKNDKQRSTKHTH
jgi:hypothetical protein